MSAPGEFVALLEHAVHARRADGSVLVVPPAGVCVRLESRLQHELREVDGVRVLAPPSFTGVYFLHGGERVPVDAVLPLVRGRRVLVSTLVAQYVAQTPMGADATLARLQMAGVSVFTPNDGPGQAVRDDQGRIVEVRSFCEWAFGQSPRNPLG
jgi:hypothetical protein